MKEKATKDDNLLDDIVNSGRPLPTNDVDNDLEETFWYKMRVKSGRIQADLENAGQNLSMLALILEKEIETLQRQFEAYREVSREMAIKNDIRIDKLESMVAELHDNKTIEEVMEGGTK
jgi:hypothetical protein